MSKGGIIEEYVNNCYCNFETPWEDKGDFTV